MPHFGELQPCYYRWLHTPMLAFSPGPVAFTIAGRVFLSQLIVPKNLRIDRLAYHVGNVSAGNVRLGLYREGPAAELPDGGAVVVETGSVAQVAVERLQLTVIPSTQLVRGRYWLCVQGDDVTGTYRYQRDDANTIGRAYDHPYGPFTDPCPATFATSRYPHMVARVVV